MFQIEQVKEIILLGASKRLKDAQKMTKELNMHVTGLGAAEYLERLEDYENEHQRKLRLKLMKSNKALFSFLLRPLDKVFSAKGGYTSYNLSESKIKGLKAFVSDVSDGLDVKSYLQKKIKKSYVIDPNGFIMIDIDGDSNIESRFYSCLDIVYIENRGNIVKGIIFNPFRNPEDPKDEKEYYRVIDEKTDSIYIKDGEDVYLDETSVVSNFFGEVPARLLGDIFDHNSDNFLSIIDDVLEDAQERLRDVSVSTVHKLSHGYAKYWQYPEACTRCGGDGEIKVMDGDSCTSSVCSSCDGSGVKNRRDPSDVMLLDIPSGDEPKVAPDVGGYINPSIEIWNKYNEELLEIRNSMFQTLWGTTYTTESNNETATGRFLDEQPVNDRLTPVSMNFSKLHKFVLDFFGKYYLLSASYESSVSYGVQYGFETADAALDKFTKANQNKLPSILQRGLLENYYQNEYSSNEIEYRKNKKLLDVDPFPFMTPNEVKSLGVDEESLKCKIYYDQWVSSIDEAKLVLFTREQLKEDLRKFANSKTIITNEQGNTL